MVVMAVDAEFVRVLCSVNLPDKGSAGKSAIDQLTRTRQSPLERVEARPGELHFVISEHELLALFFEAEGVVKPK